MAMKKKLDDNTKEHAPKHECRSCDTFPYVDMPPKSGNVCKLFVDVEPKCACCGHKHDKYVIVCDKCFKNLMDESKGGNIPY